MTCYPQVNGCVQDEPGPCIITQKVPEAAIKHLMGFVLVLNPFAKSSPVLAQQTPFYINQAFRFDWLIWVA